MSPCCQSKKKLVIIVILGLLTLNTLSIFKQSIWAIEIKLVHGPVHGAEHGLGTVSAC